MYSMYSTSVSEVKKTDTIQVTNYNIYINFINMKNNTLNTKSYTATNNVPTFARDFAVSK